MTLLESAFWSSLNLLTLSHHLPGSDVRHGLGAFQGDPLRGVQSMKKEVKTYALIQYYANQSVSDARTKKDMETRIETMTEHRWSRVYSV